MEKNFHTISRDELKQWMDAGKEFVLVDVLPEGSYKNKHLPGAKHADVSETDFLKKVEKLVSDKKTPVVVYCASFSCQLSPRAADTLAQAGYENVYDFKGGLADWEEGGYGFES